MVQSLLADVRLAVVDEAARPRLFSMLGLVASRRLEGLLKRGAYEHAARASESAPTKIHSLARRACITQAAIVVLGSLLAPREE